jgi:CheY-like chemotaxis protein
MLEQLWPELRICGFARNGQEAVEMQRELRPSVCFLDVHMPGMNGIEAARRIKEQHPEIVVILVSVERDALPSPARSGGAEAVVHKAEFGPALLRRVWARHGNGPTAMRRGG